MTGLPIVKALLIVLQTAAPASATQQSKIDPALQAALRDGSTQQVIILGSRQLLETPAGLSAFASKHQQRDRRELRKEVIARMKQLAEQEQPRIRRALAVSGGRSLWIANALVLSLTPEQIRKAATLPEVQYIYASRETLRPPGAAGALTVAATPSVPFDAGNKRVAWNVRLLGAERVWRELGITGEGVTVAVLDAGVNYLHTDLRGRVWINRAEVAGNGRDDDGNGYMDDVHGYDFARMTADVRDTSERQHGTFTAGIIAGDGTGGIITGLAPRARIMPLRGNAPSAAALAYQYALENGADVLSMSFSIPNLGNLRGFWRRISDHAVAAGLVLIGGAGNFQRSAALPYQHQSPKDVPSVISVGGVDSLRNLVPFSSMGPAEWGTVALYGDYPLPNGLIKPDVVAFPGAGYPLLASADSGYVDPNTSIRGNSFSGPQGAGIAALMLSAAPHTPAWRIREIMEATAHDLGEPGKDNRFGAGLLDAFGAVQAVRRPSS